MTRTRRYQPGRSKAPSLRGSHRRLQRHRRLIVEQLEDRRLLAAGDLDPEFGEAGLVTTEFFHGPFHSPRAYAVAIQADDKIIAAGSGGVFTRYNTDGSIDTSFGEGGRAFFEGTVNGLALQGDGKIVAAGSGGVLARYHSDGSLDTSFGDSGKAVFAGTANDLALQEDGKIVVAGASGGDFAVARYHSDGSPDTSFAGDGIQTTDFSAKTDAGYSVALDSNGRIVVAGYSYYYTVQLFAVACYNSDGSLDTSFDGDGKVTTGFGGSYEHGFSVVVDGNDKIVVAGHSYQGGNYDFAVARYHSDGSLDTSFDGDGKLTTDFGASSDEGLGVALDGSGRIVVAGAKSTESGYDFAVARYHSDGSLDATFDGDGLLTTDFDAPYDGDWGYAVALDSSGKIVVAGSSEIGYADYHFAVARYHSDGSLDTSFDGDGRIITRFDASDEAGLGVAVDGSGKIVVVGYSDNTDLGNSRDVALARYHSDGSLDTFFGSYGKVTTDFNSASDVGRSVVLDGSGKILVAGYADNGSDTDFALVRYGTNGSLDYNFAGHGRVTTDFGAGERAYALALDGNGKIVVAGSVDHGSDADFAVARYNSEGTLDTSFAGDGKQTTDFGGSRAVGQSVVVDGSGKIVVAGYVDNDSEYDFALARYHSDGSLDTSFDDDGWLTTDFGASDDYAHSVAVDSSGKIVVAGYVDNGSDCDFAIARYNSDGSLDASFAGDGKLTTDFGASDDYGRSVALDGSGKIVVAGYVDNGGEYDFAVARYNSDGSLDTGFDGDGWLATDFGASDIGSSMALDATGKMVVVGASSGDFAVARYLVEQRTLSATVDGSGVLTIADTNGSGEQNDLTVTLVNGGVDLEIRAVDVSFQAAPAGGTLSNADETLTIPLTEITSLMIDAAGGDDTLTLDFSGGDFSVPIRFDAGETDESVGDSLILQGGTFTDTIYTFNSVSGGDPDHGTIDISGNRTITYTGLEPITSTIDATNVTLNYSVAAEAITVTDAGSGQTAVDSDVAGESVTFNNPIGTLSINAGDTGDDVINIDGLTPGYPAHLTIDGGTGTDTVGFHGAVSLDNRNLTVTANTIRVDATVATGGGDVSLSAANDVTLNAMMDTGGGGLTVNADSDGDGTGTFTVDAPVVTGWREQAKLTASDAAENDYFGWSVSVSGDTAVVGASSSFNSDAVYVFIRNGNVWTQQAQFVAADADPGDDFGFSVCIDGDSVVVGAYGDDDGGFNSGAAYVFTRSGSTWTEQAKLTAFDPADDDHFGRSVSISGDTIIVGAYYDDDDGSSSGSAYVFTRSGTTWTHQAKLTAADGDDGDVFGASVSVSGDTAVVGAWGKVYAGDHGAAYVFTRSGSTWTQRAKLTAPYLDSSTYFGSSVHISGDTLVVGAPLGLNDRGSAYVYTGSGSSWVQEARLSSYDSGSRGWFGDSVSVSGDTIVVGADGNDAGSAYVFTRSGTTWTQLSRLNASDATSGDEFGCSVSVSGDTIFVGSRLDDDDGFNSGSAYVFQPEIVATGLVSTSGGALSVTAADVDVGGAIDAGSGTVSFLGSTSGRSFDLGATGGTGQIVLTDAELDLITTTNRIVIGDADAGSVIFTGKVDLANATVLEIVTGGAIGDTNPIDPDFTGTQLTLDGKVSPGTSPGVLSVVGDVELADDGSLTAEIGGTTPGMTDMDHDQLNVTGSVTIGSNVSFSTISWNGFAPWDGDVFVIIDTTAGVTGTFAGLPEGATLSDFLGSGLDATISYVGGSDGNDVVLTVPLFRTTRVFIDGNHDLIVRDTGGDDTDDALVLSVIDDSGAKKVRVHDPNNLLGADQGTIQVDANTVDVVLSTISGGKITVDTLGGDDTLTVDFGGSGGDFGTPLTEIRFDGGETAQTGGDELILQGGGTFAETTYGFHNVGGGDPDHGTIDVTGNARIIYTGLEPIRSTIDAIEVTLNYSTVAETITVTDATSGQTQVESDVAGESLVFKNPMGALTINAGDTGDDVVEILSLAASYPAHVTIAGQTGSDTVHVKGTVSLNNRNLTVTADMINVDAAVATGGGDVSLAATGDIAINAAVTTGGGVVSVTAADVELTGGIDAGAGTISFRPSTGGRSFDLGATGGTGQIVLTDAELDLVTTTDKIVIGAATGGSVTFTGPVGPANATALKIVTGGTIGDTSTADPDFTGAKLTLDGTVGPGTSPGIFSVAGDVELADNGAFTVEIGGTTPGTTDTNHDQLDATGSVTIGANVTLDTTSWNGFVPSQGDTFTIIERTGGGGTFSGLGEGATISADFLGSGQRAFITYAGGDGDDVVLEVNSVPTDIVLAPAHVAEVQPAGTAVGSFSTADPDATDSHTYSLVPGAGDMDNDSFTTAGAMLRTAEVFDYETKSSYSVRVRTDDGNGGTYDEVFTITVTDVDEDFGDAPAPYPTLLAASGPVHVIDARLFLGVNAPDADTDGFGDGVDDQGDATDDDTEGAVPDDEDGVTAFSPLITTDVTYRVTVALSNTTGGDANLVGWIDFDGSGTLDADEAGTAVVAHNDTAAVLEWNDIGSTGPDIVGGETFARFRLTSDAITAADVGGIASDGEVEDYQLEILIPGSIHGFNYEDTDGNGAYDDTVDWPLGGVEFGLTGTDVLGNVIHLTDTTDEDGRFAFTDLLPSVSGTGPGSGYTVTETVPAGYLATTATSFAHDLLSGEELVAFAGQAEPLGPGQTEMLIGEPLMFGNTVFGSIHGFKFEDVDGNGVYMEGTDKPLADVEFTLTGTDGQGSEIIQTDSTDANGYFEFTGLLPSVAGAGPGSGYTVTETVSTGHVATTATSFWHDLASGEALVAFEGQADPLEPGQTRVLIEAPLMFGNAVPGSIHGFKFEDVDGDGVYTEGTDQPLAGVEFTLAGTDGLGNGVDRTDMTDANGFFEFTGLLPSVAGAGSGTGYTVSETLPAGFGPTTPTAFVSDLHSGEALVAFEGQAMIPPPVYVELDKVYSDATAPDDRFGYSVAVDGDTAVVGADGQEAAYVYEFQDGTWTTVAKLTAGDGELGDRFGWSVGISGPTIVIGAYGDEDHGRYSGAAYVFERPGTGWATTGDYTAKLTAGDGAYDDRFGGAVAVSGDTVVIGAYRDDDRGTNSGSAYVYQRPDTGWATTGVCTAKLTAGDGAAADSFGMSVSVSGDTVVIGAYRDDDRGTNSGSAYVYERPDTGWATTGSFAAKLTAGDGAEYDQFGWSLGVDGDAVVVGAYGDDEHGADSGAAYVYERPETGWTSTASFTAKLSADDGAAQDRFGGVVSISGGTIVVGAIGDDDHGFDSGAAYVFLRPTAGWATTGSFTARLTAGDAAAAGSFGRSVSVSGDAVVIGALWDDGYGSEPGSAYFLSAEHDPRTEVLVGRPLMFGNVEMDFGDAPDPTYPTLLASDGARHIVVPGVHLGSLLDAESDGQPDGQAAGDDTHGLEDEDGVSVLWPVAPGYSARLAVTASTTGFLQGWLDLNADGDWDDAGEQFAVDEVLTVGTHRLAFDVSATATVTDTSFARFRFSTQAGLACRGLAPDGEVEDYAVAIEAVRVFVVNDTGDTTDADPGDGMCDDGSGRCTLRAALQEANAAVNLAGGPDWIVFDIPGSGPHTIQPTSALPSITDPVVLDGFSQPGYAGTPWIELDGSLAGGGVNGLRITAGDSIVRGLAINRFAGSGIELVGGAATVLEGNYIGTDVTGLQRQPNGLHGVRVSNSASNVIGGLASGTGNVISGNALSGVAIIGGAATGNLVQGNRLGTDVAGTLAVANGNHGVLINGAPGNTVGGAEAAARNVISGNTGNGVYLVGPAATGNVLVGNRIGTDVTASSPLANGEHGVIVVNAPNNTIGGATAGAGNVMSGNNFNGLFLSGSSTSGNVIQGNRMGTDGSGTVRLGNGTQGLRISGAPGNTVGGTVSGAGNVISSNGTNGISVEGEAASGNRLERNLVGTNLAGSAPLGNSGHGILVKNAASSQIVGNVVAGNGFAPSEVLFSGIFLTGNLADRNVVQGNLIGVDVSGTIAMGNANHGLAIINGGINQVGNTTPGTGNVISANGGSGVYVVGDLARLNKIQGNLIGTNLTGTAKRGNGQHGVAIVNALSNTVGGSVVGAGNVISGNALNGLYLAGSTASGNVVQGNLIGTNLAGTASLGNGTNGIRLQGVPSTQVGGRTAAAGNVISGNDFGGIYISDRSGTGNVLEGNWIGTDKTGAFSLGNANFGVLINIASNNMVGGTASGAGNTLAFQSVGVRVLGNTAATGNRIQQNSMYGHTTIGIDLGNDGATANDPDDPDAGPNQRQNFPEMTAAVLNGESLDITYSVPSAVANSTYPLVVEFFLADAGGREGQAYLGGESYPAPGADSVALTVSGISPGHLVVATATDANGNTSEFSASMGITAGRLAPEVSGGALQVSTLAPSAWFPPAGQTIAAGKSSGWAANRGSVLDIDAAGHGWYVNGPSGTRDLKSEIRDLESRMDLLTAVMHQLRPVLGLADLEGEDNLMVGALQLGQHRSRNKWRKLPAGDDTIFRQLEAHARVKSDSDFSNETKQHVATVAEIDQVLSGSDWFELP
jgi:uncharacterized delta-60 repeat protein/CSLREA domain-containing protein